MVFRLRNLSTARHLRVSKSRHLRTAKKPLPVSSDHAKAYSAGQASVSQREFDLIPVGSPLLGPATCLHRQIVSGQEKFECLHTYIPQFMSGFFLSVLMQTWIFYNCLSSRLLASIPLIDRPALFVRLEAGCRFIPFASGFVLFPTKVGRYLLLFCINFASYHVAYHINGEQPPHMAQGLRVR